MFEFIRSGSSLSKLRTRLIRLTRCHRYGFDERHTDMKSRERQKLSSYRALLSRYYSLYSPTNSPWQTTISNYRKVIVSYKILSSDWKNMIEILMICLWNTKMPNSRIAWLTKILKRLHNIGLRPVTNEYINNNDQLNGKYQPPKTCSWYLDFLSIFSSFDLPDI